MVHFCRAHFALPYLDCRISYYARTASSAAVSCTPLSALRQWCSTGAVTYSPTAVYHRYRCRPLDVAADDEYHHSRALMHVSCGRAEAVVLICLPGNAAADAMATEVSRLVGGGGGGW